MVEPAAELIEPNQSFDMFRNYDQDLAPNNDVVPAANSNLVKQIQTEIQFYKVLDNERNPNSVDVVQWWQNKSGQFPLLSKAARFIFGIPASSSSAENSFSSAGFIFSERRTNMAPRKLENLLLIRSNRDLSITNDVGFSDSLYYDDSDIEDDSNDEDDYTDDDEQQ